MICCYVHQWSEQPCPGMGPQRTPAGTTGRSRRRWKRSRITPRTSRFDWGYGHPASERATAGAEDVVGRRPKSSRARRGRTTRIRSRPIRLAAELRWPRGDPLRLALQLRRPVGDRRSGAQPHPLVRHQRNAAHEGGELAAAAVRPALHSRVGRGPGPPQLQAVRRAAVDPRCHVAGGSQGARAEASGRPTAASFDEYPPPASARRRSRWKGSQAWVSTGRRRMSPWTPGCNSGASRGTRRTGRGCGSMSAAGAGVPRLHHRHDPRDHLRMVPRAAKATAEETPANSRTTVATPGCFYRSLPAIDRFHLSRLGRFLADAERWTSEGTGGCSTGRWSCTGAG